MKKKTLFKKMEALMEIIRGHYYQKGKSLELLQHQYKKPWPGDTVANGHTLIVVSIIPEGSLYRVNQQYFLKDELQREYSWIASFSAHPNATLSEIGGYRFIIFDPVRTCLYLEDESIAGSPVVSVYNA